LGFPGCSVSSALAYVHGESLSAFTEYGTAGFAHGFSGKRKEQKEGRREKKKREKGKTTAEMAAKERSLESGNSGRQEGGKMQRGAARSTRC